MAGRLPTCRKAVRGAQSMAHLDGLARGLLCSTAMFASLLLSVALTAAPDDALPSAPCSIPGSLRGTVVSTAVPEWSIAVIRDAAGESKAYVLNATIAPDTTIVAIRTRSIVLRHSGRMETCGLGGAFVPNAPAQPKSSGPTKAASMSVERELIDGCLGDLNVCLQTARVLPTKDGLKVVNMTADSLFKKLGLEAGDVIANINGYAMTDLAKSLEVFAKVRTASNVTLDLQRKGKNVTLEYAVRD